MGQVKILGLPELPADPRFATPVARFENRDALVALLDAVTVARSSAEWMAALAGRVPVAPVLTLPEALDNPYLAAAGGIGRMDHPAAPEGLRMLASPIRLDGARPDMVAGPGLGADTDALLGALGLSGPEIAALRVDGVI